MGVQLGDIVPRQPTELGHLAGRVIALDAYNTLYQFLSIIRQPDGTPLMNSKGEVTSHLSGVLYRTAKLVEAGIKPVYVFDGVPPEEKAKVLEARTAVRREAAKKWEEALAAGEIEAARTHAQASTRLTKPMVESSKSLLSALGVPFVDAPAEGEAQAAFMARQGDCWAVASQDYDSLLFGAPILVKNLSITGRRKVPRKKVFIDVTPEIIELEKVEKELGLDRAGLIEVALLVGTDFNEGVRGIGPKKALALVKSGKTAEDVHRDHGLDASMLPRARQLFLNPGVTKDYKLSWGVPDEEKTVALLCERFEFSQERVRKAVQAMKEKLSQAGSQSRLDNWFGK
jgi:flap endonuclease-1